MNTSQQAAEAVDLSDNRIPRYDVPPVDVLMQIPGVDRETAEKIVAVLAGELDACEASPACARWVASCYHAPDADGHEVKLAACDELLGTFGVESTRDESFSDYTDEGVRMCPPFSYCNTGDSYAWTLARDHAAGQWVVAGWADLVEEYERENAPEADDSDDEGEE